MQREKERYFGTEFIHVGVIFQAPLPARALVIAEPYITIRYGNAQWTTRAFEIWMFKWPNLLGSFTHISEQARQEYLKTQSWKRLKNIITFRAMGAIFTGRISKMVCIRRFVLMVEVRCVVCSCNAGLFCESAHAIIL